ncbi:carcinoembryonic antigen-related cell adhesion molecule 1-like isoform X4 [Anguilla anguilla]|uniref:carcinoembryonic antigen-related cell adhesion molecule 1-like isoform X4 n=1 Tax=Anguilla anguilla TaxID=7936 RepID=UPI0015AE1CBC|nr:carcinoembryonic antigen-related cell adhesion molecule 1-like isoform X4 [Anguilla anguilla]
MLNTEGQKLKLENIQENQSGNYTCWAHNIETLRFKPSDPLLISVMEKISGASITGPTEVLIAGTSSAKLSCQATAGTIISRKWLKDGNPLSPSNRITFSGDNSSVSIDPLQGTDNGQYQCRLTNPVSTDSVSYNLTVNFSAGPNSESQLGAILGGTFGALGCVAVAGGALAYMKKRKRRDSPSNQDHQAAVYENTIDLSPPVVYENLPTGSTDLPCPVDSENRPDYEELRFKDTATYSNLNSI